ncbi:hypothetical protein TNCV_1657491 [Trichonephila clavipes]|nr:hypothetical protein TNCV_1657491 [Trichonephila clavipes]
MWRHGFHGQPATLNNSLRHGVNDASNLERLKVFIPWSSTFRRKLFPVLLELGGGWWYSNCLLRATQTCSIGFMSGEHGMAIPSARFLPRKENPSTRLAMRPAVIVR